MRKAIVFSLLISVFLSSCVTRKQLTYLQQDESNTKDFFELNRVKYKIQPNDILTIGVKSSEETTDEAFNSADLRNVNPNAGDLLFYLSGYTVDMNGDIELPIIGKLNVNNKNVDEIKKQIEETLGKYYNNGSFNVSVQLAGIRFTVVGDVTRPGRFVIYQNQVNIFEALASAGDITFVGDRTQVMILRQENQGIKTISLDLTNSEVIDDPYFFIQPNDVINVKPLPQKSLGIGTTGFQSFTSIFGVLASTITLIIAINSLSN